MATKKKYTKTEIGALADAFGKSLATIQRWVKSGNIILTTPKAQGILDRTNKLN